MSRVTLEPAFILHRRPYSNTSLIVELLTLNYGRVSVLARSARGLKSRYQGKLELFFPMLVNWTGRYELKSLGSVDFYGMPLHLNGDGLLCGFYLNELLMRLLHRDDPHSKLFTAYQYAVTCLVKPNQLQQVLRIFEKTLLHELGYGLPLQCELGSDEPLQADQFYQYIPDRGFLRCQKNDAQLRVFSGRSLLALYHEHFAHECELLEIKRLMRLVLSQHLGAKPLFSRALF